MGWKDKMDEWGGGEVSFLSEDGETITFIVVSDPTLLEGKFKGRISQRIGCPVVTQDGFTLLIIGKRLARRLSRFEPRFPTDGFTVTRRGEHGDIESTYELKLCEDEDLVLSLFKLKDSAVMDDVIEEAIAAAEEIMKK